MIQNSIASLHLIFITITNISACPFENHANCHSLKIFSWQTISSSIKQTINGMENLVTNFQYFLPFDVPV
uniref:Uncharacterized protein n=1 Tax=Tetranychus urticae TaxID=32264 RepID=T1K7X9_TETUR